MSDVPVGAGHNSAAPLIEIMLDPEVLVEQWRIDHAELFERAETLKKSMERFEATPINNEEIAGKGVQFAKQIKKQAQAVENVREGIKAPFKAAVDACDFTFKRNMSDVLTGMARKVEALLTSYTNQKVAAERAHREAIAREAREEADRIAKVALKTNSADMLDTAEKSDDMAQCAEAAANASLADLSRTRGDVAGLGTLRDNWVFTVVDLSKVPLEWMMLDESKVKAAMRRKVNPVREIPGLEISNSPLLRVV